jgi:UDP-3-O-[3-hydroxymyristoyl] glucosamine N-acyltransferase
MVRLTEILNVVGDRCFAYNCDYTHDFTELRSKDQTTPDSISFCHVELPMDWNGCMIMSNHDQPILNSLRLKNILFTDNPRLLFSQIANLFFAQEPPTTKIHPTAVIGKNVTIGTDTIIDAHVVIYDNCIIGDNCWIHAGCVIGCDGFGYERNNDLEIEKFPHRCIVIIEDDVEIGANTCIDRGALDNTIIGQGTKIDNLCHIAHNVKIGKHCMIVAQSMIGGSTIIGDYSYVAPHGVINNGLHIGKNAFIGLGAVVLHDVASLSIMVGVPAKPIVRKER